MYTIHDSPEWANYYKFLMNVYDFRHSPTIPEHIPSYDGLMRIHLYFTMDTKYTNVSYNYSNYKTFNDNFFHTFIKFIAMYEKYKNMDDYIKFLHTLLERSEVTPALDVPNYENKEPYECYTGYKYITHLSFMINKCDILESIQKKYRRLIHMKKLGRSLNLIKCSPPKTVEFIDFESYPGGSEYIRAFETFYLHAS